MFDLSLHGEGRHHAVSIAQVLGYGAGLGGKRKGFGKSPLERTQTGNAAVGAHIPVRALLSLDQGDGLLDRRRAPDKRHADGHASLASPHPVQPAPLEQGTCLTSRLLGPTHGKQDERIPGAREQRPGVVTNPLQNRRQSFPFAE